MKTVLVLSTENDMVYENDFMMYNSIPKQEYAPFFINGELINIINVYENIKRTEENSQIYDDLLLNEAKRIIDAEKPYIVAFLGTTLGKVDKVKQTSYIEQIIDYAILSAYSTEKTIVCLHGDVPGAPEHFTEKDEQYIQRIDNLKKALREKQNLKVIDYYLMLPAHSESVFPDKLMEEQVTQTLLDMFAENTEETRPTDKKAVKTMISKVITALELIENKQIDKIWVKLNKTYKGSINTMTIRFDDLNQDVLFSIKLPIIFTQDLLPEMAKAVLSINNFSRSLKLYMSIKEPDIRCEYRMSYKNCNINEGLIYHIMEHMRYKACDYTGWLTPVVSREKTALDVWSEAFDMYLYEDGE